LHKESRGFDGRIGSVEDAGKNVRSVTVALRCRRPDVIVTFGGLYGSPFGRKRTRLLSSENNQRLIVELIAAAT